ncbi:YCF48-related protein [Bacteroidota bacterium]
MKKVIMLFYVAIIATVAVSAQWVPVPYTHTMGVNDLHFISRQTGFAAGYHEVYKTSDGGQSWTEISADVFINGPVGVWFLTENVGFIIGSDAGGNPQVSKTINGGTSWTTTTLPVSSMGFNDPKKIFFVDNLTAYIACRSGHMYKTVDQGISWEALVTGTNNDINSVHFPNPAIGYASLSYSTNLLKTINGGNSWTEVDLGQLITVNDIYFTDLNTGYLACSGSKIMKTTNGGVSWEVFDFGTTDTFYAIEFTNKNYGYVAGGSGTIATTTNGGISWVPSSSGLSQLLYCISFPTIEVGYIASLHSPGKIIKTLNGGGILNIADIHLNSLINVFPNPAIDIITIKANNSLIGADYNIFDQSGRIVLTGKILDETSFININHLETGIYFLQVEELSKQSFKVIKK